MENFDKEHEQTSDRKLSKRKYWFIIIQKKSESDNRLIEYQDNTPAQIILKTDDLITEKSKNQTHLDVVLSGFIRSKGNSDIA